MTADQNFSLNLVPVDPTRTPLLRALSVVADGNVIWPNSGDPDQSIEIQLDDLFSFLVEFWKPLLLRQTYPLALTPQRPTLLLSDAAKRWANAPQDQVDEEASELDSFEEAHNLALAFGGLFDLPPLWLIRQGEQMLCDAGKAFVSLPFHAVVHEFAKIGDQIAGELISINAVKWGRIVEAWRNRDRASEVALVSWSASLDEEIATKLIVQGLITPPKTLAEAANDNDELLIAARVAGVLPYDYIVEILGVARSFKLHRAEALDALSTLAVQYLRILDKLEPYAQGEALAIFTREQQRIGSGQRIDVFNLMLSLGIDVRVDATGPETFDGLAIAGNHYGPGAFINRDGRRIRDKNNPDLSGDAGARVNLAHEFCHLLVDRDHPMSAVEVLQSRMPSSVESRARAFAGELLLPSNTAAMIWDQAGSPTEQSALTTVVQSLADTYGVTFSVAAWKLEHGARRGLQSAGSDGFRRLRAALDVVAPYRRTGISSTRP